MCYCYLQRDITGLRNFKKNKTMERIKYYFYAILLAFLFCIPTDAQNDVKITRVGKLIQEALPSDWECDTFMTYYIAADADSTEHFIKEGNWKPAYEKRYTPYNNVSLPLIRKCFAKSISAVLTEEQKKILNLIGRRSNIMWSEFYVFINSNKRFVKLKMRSSTAKYLSQEQIYKILLLYNKCKLPVHPVVGAFKEKEYYITGAMVDRIK